MKSRSGAAVAAWLLAAIYYFYQYTLRSSPGVMVPQLSAAFGLSAAGAASLIGLFYYGYAPFSLIAGTALDRFGAKTVIPLGALMAGSGALLFGTGSLAAANAGRFLQGAGGVFALVGAIYIIGKNFPPSRAATLVGATQMFGSSGGSAGQFLVGPMIAGGLAWNRFWTAMGVLGILIAVLLFILLPGAKSSPQRTDWLHDSAKALGVVFRNPQSILCGLIAGLLFIPTTIFDMIWGVRFLQEAHGFEYGEAVMRSATVPLGWIIGCSPDGSAFGSAWPQEAGDCRRGLRAPGVPCLDPVWPPDVLPPYVIGLIAGIASGAAMVPYTVIKEANPPEFSGTATGVISFLNFTLSALVGPVFGRIMGSVSGEPSLEHYQMTFQPLLYGVGLAIVLTFVLKETGPAVRVPAITLEMV